MLKICLTGEGYREEHFSRLMSRHFEVTHKPGYLSPQELEHIIPEFDAYVLGGDERLTEQALNSAKKLRLISFVGTGFTSFIDEQSAHQHNITVKNTPAVMAPAVAEHTLGYIIAMQRKLFQQNWQIKHDCFEPCSTEELSTKCVGIVGLGEIGSRIAKSLRLGFGSEVIYSSRSRKLDLEDALDIKFVDLDTLFSLADIIVLALPTNSKTEYFVDDTMLGKTKEGVIIINTAGARLIEPIALKKYLDNNKIAGAAFDGYYIEPLPHVLDDPFHLLALPDTKFVLTPHTAAKTTQSWIRMIDMAIDNVIQFFEE